MTLIDGKYRLLKQIGKGAMGIVWSASNTATGGQVALKLILRSEPELRARLLREAQTCGAIRHKNVVQVYDVGTTDKGDPFLVMELLQGETLAALLTRKRRLTPHEACAIARDVARALAAAHAASIVHRDLKPANIFLHVEPGEDDPVVKVVDFGVSKNPHVSDGLHTVAGGAVGSPMYMSPEQARADRALDSRADLWSLGVVLYEMLTGERPFGGDTLEVVQRILMDPIPRVARRIRKIDPDLDRIVTGLLTRDPAERLGPAAEVAKQLEPHTLPPMRAQLPSLMESGAYEASPYGAPGSGGAALSPGPGRAPLVAGSSGMSSTELRPPSGGAPLAPGSGGRGSTALTPAASAAAELYRSGQHVAHHGDDDGATIPIEPRRVEERIAAASGLQVTPPASGMPRSDWSPAMPPPASVRSGGAAPPPSDWGAAGGGTVPISASSVVGLAAPFPTAPPPALPPPGAPPAPPATSGPPAGRIGDTVRMDQSVGAALAAAKPEELSAMPLPARPAGRGDKLIVAAVIVILVCAFAAVAILVLGPKKGGEPPVPSGAAPSAPLPPPDPPPSAQQASSADVPAPPPASATAEPVPSATTEPVPSATAEPVPSATAPAASSAPPAARAPVTVVKTPPPNRTAPTTKATTTKPPCTSKFGVGCK